ncbi:unnamed protein product [Pieris brassicae]|uniref:F-box only protein 9 n=1 Tax=Pieris brassicae TaxID=7116 RepID=A0A9P0SVJ8_PIEBR|nr:unnamed protein product [Pieris brassicae]
MASATGSGSGTGTGDCEGEEQDDSSSHPEVLELTETLNSLSVDKSQEDYEDELSLFRQQWRRELEDSPSHHRHVMKPVPDSTDSSLQTEEDKAKSLFLLGVEMENGGKLYEAIKHYKKAIQILPDVESQLYKGSEVKVVARQEVLEEEEEVTNTTVADESDDEDAVEGEEFVSRIQRILTRKGHFLQANCPTKGGHMSWLPYEVLQLILRWVVSSDLDSISLEQVSTVSRGFYVAARAHELWRSMCIRTWGAECGTPRVHEFASWRQMYIERPRLNLHGCYISKTTYLRHGENSFQDQFYRPWYFIDYFRYLRFFPEGLVLMWTTPDEPINCVSHLKYRNARQSQGIMSGHYRLVENKVIIVIKKSSAEKKAPQSSNTRFRARRKESHEQEQIYHIELELRNVRSHRNWSLVWKHYAVSTRGQWSNFELGSKKFPSFMFSRVRNYTAESYEPLTSYT